MASHQVSQALEATISLSDLRMLAQDLWVRCYVEMLEGFLKSIMPTEEVMRAMGNSKQAFQVGSFPALTCSARSESAAQVLAKRMLKYHSILWSMVILLYEP